MKRNKKISCILYILFCNLIFLGCEKKSEHHEKEQITLTFFNSDLSHDIPFDDEIANRITELTGVTLKILRPAPGDNQSIPLMIASGEYPDLIYAKEDTRKLIEAGAIIKLDEYINEKGQNIKALYGNQFNRLRLSDENTNIYFVGTYGVNEKIFQPSGTMQIQHQALSELGYPKLKTVYDFEKVIEEYIEISPTTEDGLDRIGLSLMASDWRWLVTCGNIASAVIGIPDDGQYYVNDETGETTYKFIIPEIKEYFKWLNHMNDIGLLDPESFTQSEEMYRAKVASGRVIGLSDQEWNYTDSIKYLIQQGRDEATYAKLPIVLDESKYIDQSLKNYGFRGGWGISITESCNEKERAFEFLDWMASDEAQILINWGIEGVHYFYNSEGKREFYNKDMSAIANENTSIDKNIETGIGYYGYPFPQRVNGEIDSTGNPYTNKTMESVKGGYTESEKRTLAAYGVESWVELCTPAEQLSVSKHGQVWQYNIPSNSEVSTIQKKADDYCQKAITEAILGPTEEFDRSWDEIQKTLKSFNIDKLNEEMTKFTQKRIKLWNE